MTAKTILQYYADDHDRLDDLFKQFQELKRTDLARAAECFRQFAAGLRQHIVWEEDILFPEFEERTGMRSGGPTAVMRMEHRQIKQFLEAIEARAQQRDAATDSEEAGLLEVLGAHNQKEEQILYPMIDRLLSDQDRSGVFGRMGV